MGFGCDGEDRGTSDGILQWAHLDVIHQVPVCTLSADDSSFSVLLCLLCL